MPAARRFDFWPDWLRRPPPERGESSAVYRTLINTSESDYRGADGERVEAAELGARPPSAYAGNLEGAESL